MDWPILAIYMVGQFLNILFASYLAVNSKINRVYSVKKYFTLRWIPIVCRLFLTTVAFPLMWNKTFLSSDFMSTFYSQVALAGILGWFSDSALDKLLSIIPFLQKELPKHQADMPPTDEEEKQK
jgi:hypothetical protein